MSDRAYEFYVGDRVWHPVTGSVGVVTELLQVRPAPFIHDPAVPGALVKVESGPFWGRTTPFELSDLLPEGEQLNAPIASVSRNPGPGKPPLPPVRRNVGDWGPDA